MSGNKVFEGLTRAELAMNIKVDQLVHKVVYRELTSPNDTA